MKTISQRYKLEKHKRAIEMEKEKNKKIRRDITINKGMDEQYQLRATNQQKTIVQYKNKIQVLEKSLA